MVSTEKGLPASFVPGEKKADGSGIDLATTRNVRWVVRLGNDTYSSPVVADGRVYIGTNDVRIGDPKYKSTTGGLLLCLDEATGKVLWRLVMPMTEKKHKSSKFDDMDLGLCSSVTVEGDRVYLVTSRNEVVCLDVQGMSNGNDGPMTDEGRYSVPSGQPPVKPGPTDADIIWCFDIIDKIRVWTHDAANSSVLIHGDCLYVCTGNGVDGEKCPDPQSPSLIVLDKKTGRLVGFDDEKIGTRVFHGQWSSPAMGEANGRPLVLFGAGDGVCYAFEPFAGVPDKPQALKKVWQFQCNPPDHLVRDGKPINYWDGDARDDRGNRNDGKYVGPNEIVATPVCYNNRVYVATGQDPVHGRGKGTLSCIDATKTGDVSQSGRIWTYEKIDRSMSTVSISDGLLLVGDRPGVIHCLDAETGAVYWTYDTKSEIWGSGLVADGKFYIGSRKSLFVLGADKERKLLGRIRVGSPVWASPVAANGTVYIASMNYLWAVEDPARRRTALSGRTVFDHPVKGH
jgi:outer membrane protein assembly factor BamB